MSNTKICISEGGLISIPPLRLGIPSPSDKSKKSIVESLFWTPVRVNYEITEMNFLKKFIGGGLDGEIGMGAETRSGHGGPRLSMEARWRLEFAEELLE